MHARSLDASGSIHGMSVPLQSPSTSPEDDQGARKRQRLTASVSPPPLKRKAASPAAVTGPRPKAFKTSETSTTSSSAVSSQAVTPGSAKHPRIVPSPSSVSSVRSVSGVSSSPSKVPPKQPAVQKPPPAATRKPESLNPRHLKSHAPAKHEFRCRAVKMLHEQFARLNLEAKKAVGVDQSKSKQLLLSSQELIWLALDEEERTAIDKPSIYSNIIKNRIMAYKKMPLDEWITERMAEYKRQREKVPVPSEGADANGKRYLCPQNRQFDLAEELGAADRRSKGNRDWPYPGARGRTAP